MLFSFTFVYLLNVIKNKNKHISAVSITLGKKIAEKENLNVLEKRMTELLDTQKKISSYLVDTSNIDKFVGYLEGIGVNNNVELSVNSVDVVKNEKNKISVNLNIKGNFSNTMKAIVVLENSPYNLIINALYLNKEIVSSNEVIVPNNKVVSNGKEVIPITKYIWQSDISFSVLNL